LGKRVKYTFSYVHIIYRQCILTPPVPHPLQGGGYCPPVPMVTLPMYVTAPE